MAADALRVYRLNGPVCIGMPDRFAATATLRAILPKIISSIAHSFLLNELGFADRIASRSGPERPLLPSTRWGLVLFFSVPVSFIQWVKNWHHVRGLSGG